MLTEVTLVEMVAKMIWFFKGSQWGWWLRSRGQCIAQENLSSDSEKRFSPFLCATFIQSSLRITTPNWLHPTGKFMECLTREISPVVTKSDTHFWSGENNKKCQVKQICLFIPAQCFTDHSKYGQFLSSLVISYSWAKYEIHKDGMS